MFPAHRPRGHYRVVAPRRPLNVIHGKGRPRQRSGYDAIGTPAHHQRGDVRWGRLPRGHIRIDHPEGDHLAAGGVVQREHVVRPHVHGVDPRVPRAVVLHHVEPVARPDGHVHREGLRGAGRCRPSRFHVRVIVHRHEDGPGDRALDRSHAGPCDNATGTATAPATTGHQADGKHHTEKVNRRRMRTQNCFHLGLSPLSIVRFVSIPPRTRRPAFQSMNRDATSCRYLSISFPVPSLYRSAAHDHVVYRKMILPAERTPPFFVPWTWIRFRCAALPTQIRPPVVSRRSLPRSVPNDCR